MYKPLVSIGMPICNCAATLKPAIRSILAQSYPSWELLIFEDGSNDETLKVAQSFDDPRIIIFSDGKNKGLPRRLNQILSACKGKYFARMDGDDVCYPHRIERQVTYLEKHTEIDLLGTGAMVFNRSGRALGAFPFHSGHKQICAKPWAGFYLPHPTWMGRVEWFQRYRYRELIPHAEDQDLLLRSYRNSRFEALPDILLGYRLERLVLRRILQGRYDFSRALFHELCSSRDWQLIRGLIEQPLKALVDAVAIGSGANLQLLRHRASPIDEKNRRKWNEVWRRFTNDKQHVHTEGNYVRSGRFHSKGL